MKIWKVNNVINDYGKEYCRSGTYPEKKTWNAVPSSAIEKWKKLSLFLMLSISAILI